MCTYLDRIEVEHLIYDESTKLPIENPDLEAGYVYDGSIVTGYTDGYYEVMDKTVTEKRPKGLRHWVDPKPILEPCQWYHRWTEEELEQQKQDGETEKRIAALEKELANQGEELKAAKILLGVE